MSASSFARYARYYDLLYRDKDYAAEARFVTRLLAKAGAAPPGPLLDVGCGTGRHARALAALGWTVSGVDLSADMIRQARATTPPALPIDYAVGAAAGFDLGRTFPVIVSLFHVASYQAEPGECARMLANLARHLRPGGALLFDFWHGPGVRREPPEVRTRRIEGEADVVTRHCTPTHWPDDCRVDVRYDIRIEPRGCPAEAEEFSETHRLRYYSLPELAGLLEAVGLEVVETRAGVSDAPLDERSWYGLVLARRRLRP